MQAFVLTGLNQPLELQNLPNLQPETGKTIVKLHAAALNHRDVWITKGQYAGIRFPTILGSDGAGTTPNGEEVIIQSGMEWGNNPRFQSPEYHILGLPTNGTLAEYVSVPTENIYPKPSHLSMAEAAALPLAGLTAYRALMTRCQAKKGDKVLISGIGGGVALFAAQFAIAAGCEVWVTSGSEEKIQKAVALGAKGGILYSQENWAKNLLAQTGGFDVIIDSAAGNGFNDLVRVAKAGANIAFYGGTRGAINGLNPQMIFWKQLTIHGSTMGSPAEFEQMLHFVSDHKIVPIVDAVFPFEATNEAIERMDKGEQFGKLVIQIAIG